MSAVQRFVGWAVKSQRYVLQKVVFKLRRGMEKKEKKLNEYLEERKIIDAIITSEDEVMTDSEYVETYYPLVDQMNNEGGIALVAKEFVPRARESIVLINVLVNKETLEKKKKTVTKEAVTSIQTITHLYKIFHTECTKLHIISDDIIKKCHNKVALKTIHARSGLIFLIFIGNFVGHYSKTANGRLRNDLQVISKHSKNKPVKEEICKESKDEVKES